MSAPTLTRPRTGAGALGVAVVLGVGVSVALGVYARLHEPTGYALEIPGFSHGMVAKSWLTSAAMLLGVVQVVTAAGLWGRLGLRGRPWVGAVHRWAGRLALLLVVPVAAHCLYALGFSDATPRVLVHSLLGCLFFGAFATKMTALRSRTLPGWALPLLGGVVFAMLAGLWLSSALWFFATFGVHL